jgi:hypothetical protein
MLTLYINNYGGWNWTQTEYQETKVVFTGPDADKIAADYLSRKPHLVVHLDTDVVLENFPLVDEILYPSCEHGLSAWLCTGPSHYPIDM